MMKIKNLMYVLMGTMLVATSCSDAELENGNGGSGTVDPVNASALVNVYSDKSGSEASLLAGDVLVKDTRALTLNVPAACEKVYMKYNTVSGTEIMKEFALSPVSRSGDNLGKDFNFETNRLQVKVLFFTRKPFIHRRNRKKGGGGDRKIENKYPVGKCIRLM